MNWGVRTLQVLNWDVCTPQEPTSACKDRYSCLSYREEKETLLQEKTEESSSQQVEKDLKRRSKSERNGYERTLFTNRHLYIHSEEKELKNDMPDDTEDRERTRILMKRNRREGKTDRVRDSILTGRRLSGERLDEDKKRELEEGGRCTGKMNRMNQGIHSLRREERKRGSDKGASFQEDERRE